MKFHLREISLRAHKELDFLPYLLFFFEHTISILFICSQYAQKELLWDGIIFFAYDIGTARINKIFVLNKIELQQQQQWITKT